ncbi:MAG: glycosyltransferase [bacterium]
MRILIVHDSSIPALTYGGIERVIWSLGKELVRLGHEVTYLVMQNSRCDFARVIPFDRHKRIVDQIPDEIDVIHFHFPPPDLCEVRKPYLVTIHGNCSHTRPFDRNSVFVSRNHASRFGSECYVYNGLDWEEYTKPDFSLVRTYYHFLGDASWKVKNLKGAIEIIKKTRSQTLKVMGGHRLNFRMGFRLTITRRVSFLGFLGGEAKDRVLNGSKGLIYPVVWHEPFGLAIIESLYFGCPVFGTPYGSLPELVTEDIGFLSRSKSELAAAIEEFRFDPLKCHKYAVTRFNARRMTLDYLEKYKMVIDGEYLNPVNPRLRSLEDARLLALTE